ncbi:hypothetical protein [Thermodesulfovibrio sp.]|uniref:hypothetical protein n=1 Tax=Thermodesulfovibrio sp. TaxID=2067987 RepID=UPI00309BB360
MSKGRKGEKIGWVGGLCGGFLFVPIISIIFLFQNKWTQGLTGLFLTLSISFVILYFVPWRFTKTPYWKLLLPIYGMFILAGLWMLWSFTAFQSYEFKWSDIWWVLWFFLIMLFPILNKNFRNRKWENHYIEQSK